MQLENKTTLITGGNSGIGLAIAHEFKAQGARVALTGRRAEATNEAAAAVGGDTIGIQGDVSNLTDLDRMYEAVQETLGTIDVLVVNAGLGVVRPLDATDEAAYDLQMNVNVKGAFYTVQKALPHLHDGASIVITGSVAGHLGMPGFAVYSATKAAVRSFARTFAAELAPRGIRVNVLSPGPIETPIFDKMGLEQTEIDAFAEQLGAQVPLARFGRPEEMAKAALFLASDASSYVTGADLHADGGLTQV